MEVRLPPLFTLAGVATAGENSGVLDVWMSELDGEVTAGDKRGSKAVSALLPSAPAGLASCPMLCMPWEGPGLTTHRSLGFDPPV